MCKWQWAWVVGTRARGPSGAPNFSGARGSRGGGGAADQEPTDWRSADASRGSLAVGWVTPPASAGAREKSGSRADLFPSAARPELGKLEAGVRRARERRARAQRSLLETAALAPPAYCPQLYICSQPLSSFGS